MLAISERPCFPKSVFERRKQTAILYHHNPACLLHAIFANFRPEWLISFSPSHTGIGLLGGLAPFQHLCLFITVLFTHCSHIRAKGSLSPARPHEPRAGDAALHRESTVIYRCFRQGVTANTRALEETKHAAAAAALCLYLDRAAA